MTDQPDANGVLQAVYDRANSALRVSGSGGGDVSTAVILAPATSARNVVQGTGDVTELTLKAAAGQTVSIGVVKDEFGAVIALVSPTGDLLTFPGGGQAGCNLAIGNPSTDPVFASFDYTDRVDLRRGGLGLYSQSDDAARRVQVFADATVDEPAVADTYHASFGGNGSGGSVPSIPGWLGIYDETKAQFVVAVKVGQTAPAYAAYDETGAVVERVMPNGSIISNAHAAPADGALNNSDFSLWLDDTPGATVLKIKAKDSAGTVRTGSIPLA